MFESIESTVSESNQNFIPNDKIYDVPNRIFEEARDLLQTTNHATDYLDEEFNDYVNNKSWLMNLLSQDPDWDPDRLAVIKSVSLEKDIDETLATDIIAELEKFKDYLLKTNEIKIKSFAYQEVRDLVCSYANIKRIMRENSITSVYLKGVKLSYTDITERYSKFIIIDNLFTNYDTYCYNNQFYKLNHYDLDVVRIIDLILDFMDKPSIYMEEYCIQVLNNIIKKYYNGQKVNSSQKATKIIDKIGKIFNFNKYERPVEKINPITGEIKTVNMGWNKIRTMIGDCLSCKKEKIKIAISCNFVDYLTMSNGSSWTSCHTIDPQGNVFKSTQKNYEGAYMAGTLSYAKDSSTIILYQVNDDKYSSCLPKYPDALELFPKTRRQCYHISKDMRGFIASRVYPDGRDGGSKTVNEQFANVFKDVIKNIIGYKYDIQKTKILYYDTNGCQYEDYYHCNDVKHYILKGYEYNDVKGIVIGEYPRYLDTGYINTHESDDDYGVLEENTNSLECDQCGEVFNPNREEYISINDGSFVFCCESCANSYGYYEVEDAYGNYVWRFRDEIVYSNYSECYIDWDIAIVAIDSDGNTNYYRNYEDAYNDDCMEIDGTLYTCNSYCYCDVCDNYVLKEEYDNKKDCCIECAGRMEKEEVA